MNTGILQACNLQFHHTGCLTKSINSSLHFYKEILQFKNISQEYFVTDQNVKVCFVEVGNGVFIELVEPQVENNFFNKLLLQKNPYYHIGYFTDAFSESIEYLTKNNCFLINMFNSEAFSGSRCAFLYSKEMHLLEIIENRDAF